MDRRNHPVATPQEAGTSEQREEGDEGRGMKDRKPKKDRSRLTKLPADSSHSGPSHADLRGTGAGRPAGHEAPMPPPPGPEDPASDPANRRTAAPRGGGRAGRGPARRDGRD